MVLAQLFGAGYADESWPYGPEHLGGLDVKRKQEKAETERVFAIAVRWEEIRRNPEYLRIRDRFLKSNTVPDDDLIALQRIGYFYPIPVYSHYTADQLLVLEGYTPIVEPGTKVSPPKTETDTARLPREYAPVPMSALRPRWLMMSPTTFVGRPPRYMLDADTAGSVIAVPEEYPSSQWPDERDPMAVHLWTEGRAKTIKDAVEGVRQWEQESLKVAGEDAQSRMSDEEAERLAKAFRAKPTLSAWSLLPIGVDWRLGKDAFRAAMDEFYEKRIKPIQRVMGEELKRSTWKDRLKGIQILTEVEKKFPRIRAKWQNDEEALEYSRALTEQADEIEEYVTGHKGLGPKHEARERRFRRILDRCGELRMYWPPRPYPKGWWTRERAIQMRASKKYKTEEASEEDIEQYIREEAKGYGKKELPLLPDDKGDEGEPVY